MQMNLDFCFLDDARVVAVTGWSTQPLAGLRLHVDNEVLSPVLVTRHVRRDLRSSEPLGVIALFDLSALPDGVDPAQAILHLADGEDFAELHNHRLASDLQRLVEIGVDEVFFALLRLLAQRHLQLSAAPEICARLRLAPSAAQETASHILAVDRCQASAAGQGAVIGWFMPALTTAEPLCALAIADDSLAPVELLPGSMAREDLAGYAPRYRFSGRDGYCGGWRFAHPPLGVVRLLLLLPGEAFSAGVLVPAEQVAPPELAQNIAQAAQGLDDIADRARLRRALLPMDLPRPVLPAGAPAGDDDTLLVLDHNLADTDLRDVLRGIGPHLSGRLRLHLLRPRLTPALRNGIDGAAREVTLGFRIEGVALTIGTPQSLPGRVIFARSSVLVQLDPALLFDAAATTPRAVLIDPIGTILATPTARAERFARDLLPFALSMSGPDFFGLLAQVPHCFLTEEARLRLLVEALTAEGTIALHRADIFRYFEGRSGPHCQGFGDGGDWHAHDAESRRLIERAFA